MIELEEDAAWRLVEYGASRHEIAIALATARMEGHNEALKKAAKFCRDHMMANPHGTLKPTHSNYVVDVIHEETKMTGMTHQGDGYAVAIDKMVIGDGG